MTQSASDRWPNASVALHWVGAMLIVGLSAVGFLMTDLAPSSSSRLLLSRMHTLGGATLMLLPIGRLITRRRRARVEPLPASDLHRRGIGVIHGLLYGVTFALGLTGFVTGATSTWPDYLQGALADAPELEALASRQAHEALVFLLLSLVVLHVGGVVVHQLRRGGVVRRMVPFLK